MTLYSIRDWDSLFENNRSRSVKDLSWVAIPNRHDGENFTSIMLHPNGAEIFSAWILILQVASRCQPRGTLLRDSKKPHDSDSLSKKTRAPKKWFDLALKFLTENTDWIVIEELADGRQETVSVLSASCQSGDASRARAEWKGMEGNGREQNSITVETQSRILLHLLNEKSGRHFRETDTNLNFIMHRLKEPGVDLDGCKQMIERQVKRWKGTDQEEYLRPETLFNKTKFEGYYAAKDQPIPERTNGNHQPNRGQSHVPNHEDGF